MDEFTDLGLTDTEMGTDEESSENTLESEVSQSPEQYEALTIQDYNHSGGIPIRRHIHDSRIFFTWNN